MKRLILMRHAKSDWKTGQEDHDRPLNARGRRAATVLGDWLRQNGQLPDAVLSSSAMRTRETLDRLQIKAQATFDPTLYLADSSVLESVLKRATGERVLMLGHNPGIGDFAAELMERPVDHPRFQVYPTGATLIADFDIDHWQDLHLGTGRLVDFIVPRDLTD
ncbi:histidine phosphatase family protein [Ponticoccus gilvus]|nr:histidine phosphatase family protein [Enemella evansiae]